MLNFYRFQTLLYNDASVIRKAPALGLLDKKSLFKYRAEKKNQIGLMNDSSQNTIKLQ